MLASEPERLEMRSLDTESKLAQIQREIQSRANIDMGDYSVYIQDGEWVEQGPGVFSSLCTLGGRHLTALNVVFFENATLPLHKHPHNSEEIFVISGSVQERISGKVLTPGTLHRIDPGVYHEFYSQNGCRCKVIFRPAMSMN
jgi:quercetin dioxygenase-like cupin family protein